MIADQIMTEFETPSNPFPGLRPFEFDESLLYFGRDGQSEQLLRKLVAARFMAVVGTSGSGKSSLVRAGLLPALFGGFMTSADSDWHIAIFRPSNDPIGNLARAINDSGLFGTPHEENAGVQETMIESTLRRGSLGLIETARLAQIGTSDHLLIVVDQFEELFRFAQVAEGERYQNDAAAFVKLLLEASRQREIPIYVVLTMRSDFLGDCSLFWDLPEALNEGQYLIPRLTREQRREAITGPAAVCGAALTPRLINRLLNDMGDNPDQLPILQHALMRTWNRWREENQESEPIDLQHYEAIGEMRAALSRHADEAYNELADDRSRVIAEKIFKGLTEKGTDNREIRRPMELKELCAVSEASEAEVIAVIEVFRREGRSFLMPPAATPLDDNSLIDISHESLIRHWDRLKAWVDEEGRSARIYRRLAETSVLHEKGEAGLYRDPDLQLALDWREGSRPNKTWARRYHPEYETSMTFLDQSREARDQEARDREAHRRKEIKRTRLTAIIFAFAFVLSLAALGFANSKRVEANESKKELEAALQDAHEQRELANEERDKAVFLTQVAESKSIEAINAKKEANDQARIASDNEAKAEAATLEARAEAKKAADEKERAENEVERSRLLLYTANINLAQDAYYEENIQQAQTLLEDDSTKYEDLRGFEWGYLNWLYHREAGALDGRDGLITDVVFSPDGKYLATIGEKSVKLWDAASRRELHSIPANNGPVNALAFSPDGALLAYGGEDSAIRLHRIGTTEEAAVLRGDGHPVSTLLFSGDGKTLIAGSGNKRDSGGIKIWDVALPQERFQERLDVPDVKGDVSGIALSADQKMLAIARADNSLILFDTCSRKADSVAEIPYAMSVAFSPDGRTIIAGAFGGFVLFDAKEKKTLALLGGFSWKIPGSSNRSSSIAFSPDGKTFAVGSFNTLRLYDANLDSQATPRLITPLLGQKGQILSLSFSLDGKTLAANDSASVRFWDAAVPRDSVALAKREGLIGKIFVSADSKTVSIINDKEAFVKSWDAASRQELSVPAKFLEELRGLAYSPDGRFLATINGGRSDTINLWDTSPRKLIANLSESLTQSDAATEFIRSVAVSPDGKTVAAINIIAKAKVESDKAHKSVLKLWSTDSPREPVILEDDLNPAVSTIEFSPDGRTLVCLGQFGKEPIVKLWDVSVRKELSLPYLDIGVPEKTFFSHDGNKVVVSGKTVDGSPIAELWDMRLKKRLATLARGDEELQGVFSPDGKVFASTPRFNETTIVTLWDTQTGRPLTTLEGYTEPVLCMAFSPDGKILATGGDDGLLKVWSVSSHRLLITLYDENKKPFSSLAFSPDNRMLITGSGDGNVRLWPTASANAIER
jgi:WD40 repeat protein